MSNNIKETYPSMMDGRYFEGRRVVCGNLNGTFRYDSPAPKPLTLFYCAYCGQNQPHTEIKKVQNY